MQTLFPIEPVYPPGFSYQEQFITPREEARLINEIQQTPLHTFEFQGYAAKRKVASFGYDWNFERKELSKGRDIPSSFQWLVDRVANNLSLISSDFSELLLTEYPVGAVIDWHRDAPPFALIAGVSLGADCTFKLRPYEKEKQNRKAIVSIKVKQRSLYTMHGEAREGWQHSISPIQAVRYSITLRTLK